MATRAEPVIVIVTSNKEKALMFSHRNDGGGTPVRHYRVTEIQVESNYQDKYMEPA